MATDDQQVLVAGQATAPATFKIPGNGQIQPKAVFAHYDGTAAPGSFLPALKVISDGGEVVGVYPVPLASTVAAGGTADVSWFPRVGGGQGQSGSAAGATTTIFHQQLTAPALSIGTAANVIPPTFQHFQLVARLRTDRAVVNDVAAITMNGDTGANYDRASVTWNGVAIAFSSTYATTGMVLDTLGGSADANRFATIQSIFLDYIDTASFKNGQTVAAEIGTPADVNVRLSLTTNWTWRNTGAINQITITPTTAGVHFVAGTSLTLYGIPPIVGT